MGIIKAAVNAVTGALADQWMEVIEAGSMGDNTVFTRGVTVRRGDARNQNRKGTADVVSNGSIIHVYPGQFMMLVDGGKVVDYTAEPGYFKVENSSAPSLFGGEFGEALKDTFRRVKYAGVPSYSQKVYFINLQEIKGIKFGTRSPVNYFDNFYNAELFLRAHGTYSIKITDPIKFYTEALPKNADHVEIGTINEQYLSEFLEALQAAVNRMSADGIRISYVASKSRELSSYMANELDEEWRNLRGIEVVSVGIASVSYDDESKNLINMRNQGAMLSDASVREGYVQGAMARGFEAAGSNANGSAQAFMGMGMGMGAGGGFMASASESNRAQMERDAQQRRADAEAAANRWTCSCGTVNTGRFCSECGGRRPEANAANSWTCSCGTVNTGRFCSECGGRRPEDDSWVCTECGHRNSGAGRFCPECGARRA